MKVHRKSWHCRVYLKSQGLTEVRGPVNLCHYVQEIATYCLTATIGMIFWIVLAPAIIVTMLLHGYYPTHYYPTENFARAYKPISVFGRLFYPNAGVIPLLALAVFLHILSDVYPQEFAKNPLLHVVLLLLIACAFGVFVYGSMQLSKHNLKTQGIARPLTASTTNSLLYEYIKAKKSKVCPTLTFED